VQFQFTTIVIKACIAAVLGAECQQVGVTSNVAPGDSSALIRQSLQQRHRSKLFERAAEALGEDELPQSEPAEFDRGDEQLKHRSYRYVSYR
jgi:hypothetical protein